MKDKKYAIQYFLKARTTPFSTSRETSIGIKAVTIHSCVRCYIYSSRPHVRQLRYIKTQEEYAQMYNHTKQIRLQLNFKERKAFYTFPEFFFLNKTKKKNPISFPSRRYGTLFRHSSEQVYPKLHNFLCICTYSYPIINLIIPSGLWIHL